MIKWNYGGLSLLIIIPPQPTEDLPRAPSPTPPTPTDIANGRRPDDEDRRPSWRLRVDLNDKNKVRDYH